DFFGVQNTRKARTGIFAGLQDASFFAQKTAAESKLRAAVDGNPEWKKQWGDAWDKVASAKKVQKEIVVRMTGLGGLGLGLGGQLFAKARDLVRLADEKEKPNSDRL